MSGLRILTPREASALACFVDTVVAPDGGLPPVARTDAVVFLDSYLARSPAPNRAGLRAAFAALELAPLSFSRRRLRRLPDRAARAGALDRLERTPLAPMLYAARSLAAIAYYGDEAVLRADGYDADAVVARGRALRAQEARW